MFATAVPAAIEKMIAVVRLIPAGAGLVSVLV
jgi:hypothetical protein